ncbi:MAG: hypothetical protein ACRBBN_15790 [Methyloligellaceae bacterium]
MRTILSVIIFCLISIDVASAYTPERGSPARKAIMNAARGPIMKELAGQKIVFVVRKLNLIRGWAYLEAVPKLRNGGKINYKITRHAEAVRQGFFDEWVGVLLKHNGDRWIVTTYVIGATDYPVVAWPQEFGAPTDLFE